MESPRARASQCQIFTVLETLLVGEVLTCVGAVHHHCDRALCSATLS